MFLGKLIRKPEAGVFIKSNLPLNSSIQVTAAAINLNKKFIVLSICIPLSYVVLLPARTP